MRGSTTCDLRHILAGWSRENFSSAMEIIRVEPRDSKPKYPWQRAVFDALVEYDPDHLQDMIIVADSAIVRRLLQKPTELDELVALRDAFSALRIVCPVG